MIVRMCYRYAVMADKYAIIETDGKQHRVTEGAIIRTDAIHAEVGSVITFEKVLFSQYRLQNDGRSSYRCRCHRDRYGAFTRKRQKDSCLQIQAEKARS